MTWYNGDYFNFGPDDAPNTDRWAEWQVELRYPGKYIVSENMATGNGTGHSWQLQLLDANDSPVSTYTTESTWAEGAITYEDKWNLTNVAKGVYTLRVQNVMAWGQPKLQYISLQYDGVLPAGIQNPTEGEAQGQAFDILGSSLLARAVILAWIGSSSDLAFSADSLVQPDSSTDTLL